MRFTLSLTPSEFLLLREALVQFVRKADPSTLGDARQYAEAMFTLGEKLGESYERSFRSEEAAK